MSGELVGVRAALSAAEAKVADLTTRESTLRADIAQLERDARNNADVS